MTTSVLVLGLGRWGNEWLTTIDSHPATVVAGTAGGRRTTATKSLARAPHVADFRQAVREIAADTVVITLPVQLHAEAIEVALEAGRHVLCEKPLAGNRGDLDRIVAMARERAEFVVMVDQNYRFRHWARAMRAALDGGIVGDVSQLAVRFARPEFLGGGRRHMANPLVEDMAIHHLDLIRYLCDTNAVEVYAKQGRPPWSEYENASDLDMVLTLESGIRVNYHGTWSARGGMTPWDGEYEVRGSEGVLSWIGGDFRMRGTNDEDRSDAIIRYGLDSVPDPAAEIGPDRTTALDTFLAAIDNGRPVETGIEDNRRTVAMQLAAIDSLAIGVPVAVE